LNLFSSTDNDWYIAGLQVEVGSVATDFEFEPHSVTLARCHRYLELWKGNAADATHIAAGFASSTSQAVVPVQYVAKRAIPTITSSAATDLNLAFQGGAVALTGITMDQASTTTGRLTCSDAAAGLTVGHATNIYLDAGADVYVGFSAEL
jgi:hypothetical protein